MVVVPERIGVAVATSDGKPVTSWRPDRYQSLTWTREKSQVSRCDLTVPFRPGPQLIHWYHWMSVWDMDAPVENGPLWKGPVIDIARDDEAMVLSGRDVGVFGQKTRTPMTKSWDGTYPAYIAKELWAAMLDMRGFDDVIMVNDDPLGDPFDFEAVQDEKRVSLVLDELVKRGLTWTVVGGTVVLGPMPLEPVAALGRNHLVDHDFKLVQDGSAMCNDVVVRGADTWAREALPMPGGVILQESVSLDDMFGVSNVQKSAKQFLREHTLVREIVVGRRTKLAANAPIRLAQCVPSARIALSLYGQTSTYEINSLEVSVTSNESVASIGVESVNDNPPELDAFYEVGGL